MKEKNDFHSQIGNLLSDSGDKQKAKTKQASRNLNILQENAYHTAIKGAFGFSSTKSKSSQSFSKVQRPDNCRNVFQSQIEFI